MMSHVFFERAAIHRAVAAVGADEWFLITVDPDVLLEVAYVRAPIAALWTLMRPLACVCPDVVFKVLPSLGYVPAYVAHMMAAQAPPPATGWFYPRLNACITTITITISSSSYHPTAKPAHVTTSCHSLAVRCTPRPLQRDTSHITLPVAHALSHHTHALYDALLASCMKEYYSTDSNINKKPFTN